MSTPTVIQSCAALYGIVPGAAGVTFVNGQIGTGKAFATEDAMLNHYYEATFTVWAPKTTAQVAGLIVANLGLTGDTATSEAARIAGLLDGVAMNVRGAKVKEIVTAFEATPAAATFNAAKAALVTAVADPTYQGIPGKGVGELVFASLSTAQIQLGTSEAINTVLLTTGVDTVPGSTGTELITAGSTSLSSTDTLQASDQIDGGAGRDTANIAINKNFGGFTVGTGFMKNVETVNLTNSSNTAVTFTARAVEGVENYNVSGPVSVNGIASLSTRANLSAMQSVADGIDLTVGYADVAVTSSTDAATIGLSNIGRDGPSSSPFTSTFAGIDLTVPGVETLTLSVAGSNNLSFDGTGPSALVVNGDGRLALDTMGTSAALKSYDGSTGTGVQIVNFTNAAGMTSIKTGSVDDQIRVTGAATQVFSAVASIDGGAGADTLRVDLAANITSAWTLNGIETLSLNGASSLTLAPSSVKGLETISVATSAAGANSITGLGAVPIKVSLAGPASGGTDLDGDLTVENTGAATLTAALASGTSSGTVLDDVTFEKATSLIVDLPAGVTYNTGAITASKATSVTLNTGSSSNFSHATDGLVVGSATSITVNHKGTGTMLLGVSKGSATTSKLTDLTITNVGAVTLSSGNTAFESLERFKVDTESAFTYTTTGLTKATSVTASGSKDASSVTLAALGGDVAYPLTLTVSGLKAGFTATTLQVGSGQSINVDVSGKTGLTAGTNSTAMDSLSVGAAGTTARASIPSPLTGSIVVNGKSATDTGNLEIDGNIFAKTVNIDLSGSSFGSKSTGVVAIGEAAAGSSADEITGDTVTIKSSSSPVSFLVGTIHAKDSIVFHGPSTVAANTAGTANPVVMSAHTGSTALTVDLLGSLEVDAFTIAGISTSTGITVTGDLKQDVGTGDDIVTINGAASTASAGQTINVSALVDSTTSITGSAGKDTILGGAGKDTIIGGMNADTINISTGGDDTIVYLNLPLETAEIANKTKTDGVSVTLETGDLKANEYISTSSLDKIIGFAAGDKIVTNTVSGSTPVNTTAKQTIGSALGVGKKLSDGTDILAAATIDIFVTGTYDAGNNRFTFSDGGADTLYLVEATGSTSAEVYHGIVLVGYVQGGSNGTSPTGLVGAALAS